ncbi:hypothetical protein BDB00DRAFT_795127 [Zychaea mexicana]|uniref:uncharacterized protein n=1 Tax=Zychaea mexicana TaxID=64656 RepID=UPI0022FF0F02|nr:uncharacterized protein BDB00DRAFT_795127 [Zychaea mexicana]KAI9499688.1 hypothetical protein BDB00DRAFT_795127 [Zychaea mexicana]
MEVWLKLPIGFRLLFSDKRHLAHNLEDLFVSSKVNDNMGGRASDLLLKILVQPPIFLYHRRIASSSLPITLLKRCHGCGRFVRGGERSAFTHSVSTARSTSIQWKRGLVTQATAAATTESAPLPEQEEETRTTATFNPLIEHPRDISAAIIKLSRKRRTTEALHKYLRALAHDQFPSKESLYQLSYALYRQKNLTGLYALHDTLLLQYKNRSKSIMSQSRERSMVYLYTMLIKLIADKSTSPSRHNNNAPLDMKSIARLCHEMAEYNLSDRTSLYNSLIHLFMKRRDLSSCHALYDNMKQRHIPPTVYTYSIMLEVYGWQKDLDGMSRLLDDMYDRGISPDAGIVSVVVFGLCRRREYDTAHNFVNGLFQSSGGDARLIGIKMRERLLKGINQAEEKRHKLVRARKIWRNNSKKNKRRKKV